MNTASRIESNGMPNRIHVSQECADLLILAGKTKWLTTREGGIAAKGKGILQTYWLSLGGSGDGSNHAGSETHSEAPSGLSTTTDH
jgi:class 3 adenylate cyclase